jgi:hypothetical protein
MSIDFRFLHQKIGCVEVRPLEGCWLLFLLFLAENCGSLYTCLCEAHFMLDRLMNYCIYEGGKLPNGSAILIPHMHTVQWCNPRFTKLGVLERMPVNA